MRQLYAAVALEKALVNFLGKRERVDQAILTGSTLA